MRDVKSILGADAMQSELTLERLFDHSFPGQITAPRRVKPTLSASSSTIGSSSAEAGLQRIGPR